MNKYEIKKYVTIVTFNILCANPTLNNTHTHMIFGMEEDHLSPKEEIIMKEGIKIKKSSSH